LTNEILLVPKTSTSTAERKKQLHLNSNSFQCIYASVLQPYSAVILTGHNTAGTIP